MPPRPYRIDVPQDVLTDLHRRLDNTRFPDPLPGGPWAHGADLSYVRELCTYWRHQYDWRRHEAELNRYPQFMCEVDGVDIHFWHVRGKGPSPLPLLLTHGWPGSIHDFHHLIGPLTDPAAHGGDAADAFDVVIPSLPGHGFSGKPREPGWNASRVAAAFDRLMTEHLGHPRYGAQGGDWGGIVSTILGAEHAEHLVGIHLNMALAGPPPGEEQSELARAYGQKAAMLLATELSHTQVQSTKPMSLTIGQSDSPAGLAAWIVEKFRTWSDCDGELERVLSKDWLLTNLMFYWATNSAASAANLYYETFGVRRVEQSGPVRVPTAVAVFPKEIPLPPRHWLEARYNLRRYTEMARGGHFASVDAPELFLEDVRAFFRELR
ncbi:epoxide hydrolase family protein [Archangium violaceum]|uniref:Multidrug MFS transporter n=1 Tax=Archangium violaceum Cb vi76 TaxID=1406225 RepID=A0A084SZD5_9BACT|nr:epoxide hydrolase family protein [Archangium violaceum]KFA93820.1 multidrug MFS transporter [Archangium violaceum Cb vi76]